ncbi:four-carbon acid sugar kinase family protein [Streptomyces winkii]|uniref:four-carbon acid sugar kinase family protein n=1 Tax=Streptomyces winkii TaxID=3051178 RepID=UPI0028D4F089|nr:four-carbon acid sugar kinase family protein [Streptomyces sp. DSM 40971]
MSPVTRSLRAPRPVLALADDLSGAAETAAALAVRSRLVLGPATVVPPERGEAVVVDLDSRWSSADEAARAVRTSLAAGTPDDAVLFKKADSLLRGNIAAEAAAYAAGAQAVVIAPALPVAGRTVLDGVVHLHGTPLHATDAWRAESGPVPRSVPDALGAIRTETVPLAGVRAGPDALAGRLRAIAADGGHPVCDAETQSDLDAVAAAALRLGPGFRLLGAGGLALALGRHLTEGRPHQQAEAGQSLSPRPQANRPLLIVVGTADPGAVAQIAQLTSNGVRHIALSPDALGKAEPPRLDVVPSGITVVSIDNSRGVRPGSGRRLVTALARSVAGVPTRADLVLTGGETARCVLDALGITQLTPAGQIHHGAVCAYAPDGRTVVTRPGSFGDADSLLRIARALRPLPRPAPPAPSAAPAAQPSPVAQGEAL